MTRITKLTCKGFKSFAKKTDIPFIGNHAIVIGPNGSGKSNIVDALCFVLGKSSAKSLRAEKSANLIYNGGKKGTPAKEAEVSIFFDNKKKAFPLPEKEIKVTRVVKKSGSSVYKINDKTHTRQQVVDVLRAARIDPDGHNVVLQGDVIHFVSMKATERREIVEDVAGISIFEEKKKQAMNELNKVQERLSEAEIILTEREKTLKDLKKDRDQALEYKRVEKDIERSKATRVHLHLKDKKERLELVEKEFGKHEGDIQQVQAEIDGLKEAILQKKKEIQAITEELNEKGDKRQRELGKEIENLKTTIIKDSSRRDVCENEVKKLKERHKALSQSVQEYEKKLSDLQRKGEGLTKSNEQLERKEVLVGKRMEAYKKKHGIVQQDDISQLIEDLDGKIDEQQRSVLASEEERQQILRKKDRLEYEVQNVGQRVAHVESLAAEDKEKLVQLKKHRDEFALITKTLSKALNESSVYSVQLGSARTKLMDAQDEFARLRTRSIGIREASAGDVAIKRILSKNMQGVHGTVADLGQVNSEYALALEIAAGARMKSVVVSSDQVAAKCIQYLKENKLGVVTFLPLNKLRERSIRPEVRKLATASGVKGLAIDLVEHSSKYATVFKFVFGGTLVVDSLGAARKLGVGRARMVTLDGDLLEESGAMVGGFRRRGSSGLGFQQKEVSGGMALLEKDMERLSKTVQLLEGQKTENEEVIIRSRERKAVLEAQIKAAEVKMGGGEDLKALREREKGLNATMKVLEKQAREQEKVVKELGLALQSVQQEKQKHVEALSKLSSSTVSEGLESFATEKRAIREQLIKNESEAQRIQNERGLYQGEQDKVHLILKQNEKEDVQFLQELKGLLDELHANKDILKIKEQNQKKFYAEYRDMFAKRQKAEQHVQKKDSVLIRMEERIRSIEGRRNDVSVKKAVLGGEVEGLLKEFEQYEGVQLRRGVALQELVAEVQNFERMLKNLGNVNLRALEIYEKVDEEYKQLVEKFDTLRLEKEDVLKMMYEIESKKEESFMKTYKLLERNFKEIFSTLSSKGDAELVIENPESVFEGGIDIRVRIAGKRYLDIKGLSGGEKTMAALAFIFAIQEFEPSWFYLMDEVDAALDKHNSALLSKLIGKYSSAAQYIVISHNDAVISEADTIYGVTMQDGVSKVMSLKV